MTLADDDGIAASFDIEPVVIRCFAIRREGRKSLQAHVTGRPIVGTGPTEQCLSIWLTVVRPDPIGERCRHELALQRVWQPNARCHGQGARDHVRGVRTPMPGRGDGRDRADRRRRRRLRVWRLRCWIRCRDSRYTGTAKEQTQRQRERHSEKRQPSAHPELSTVGDQQDEPLSPTARCDATPLTAGLDHETLAHALALRRLVS